MRHCIHRRERHCDAQSVYKLGVCLDRNDEQEVVELATPLTVRIWLTMESVEDSHVLQDWRKDNPDRPLRNIVEGPNLVHEVEEGQRGQRFQWTPVAGIGQLAA